MHACKIEDNRYTKIKLLMGALNAFQYIKANEQKFKDRKLIILGPKHEVETLYIMGFPKYYAKEFYNS